MLKAIWPSIAHIPNRLPASSNITTVGPFTEFYSPHVLRNSNTLYLFRHDVLLSLLAHSISSYVHITPEHQTFLHCQGNRRPYCMVEHPHLGLRQSPAQNELGPIAHKSTRKWVKLGLVERFK